MLELTTPKSASTSSNERGDLASASWGALVPIDPTKPSPKAITTSSRAARLRADHILARDNSSEVPLYLYSFFRLTSRKIVGKFLLPASWQAPTLHLAARQLLVVGEEVAVPLVDLACPVKGCALH